MISNCPLCQGEGVTFFNKNSRIYNKCQICEGIYIDKNSLLSKEAEKARYEHHNNDVNDEGYQNFVSPIINGIIKDFSPQHDGLDFGAGPGPVLSKLLLDRNYSIKQYDPFFHNHPNLLMHTYDYIACCEVMEHFNNPEKEFKLLNNLLKPNGKLYCYTHMYDASTNLETWYYTNDPTHAFIYNTTTINWIKTNMDFSIVSINKKLITFSK